MKFSSTASATLLAAGLVGAAPALAFADAQTDGSGGTASGNQINVPVDVETELCGNSLAILGISKAECSDVAKVLYAAGEGGDGAQTDGSGGTASGNQINIPVDAAIDVCGNSAAVGGVSEAECTKIAKKLADESGSDDAPKTDGSGGAASGNQINIPVNVAIDVCGNSVAVLGASKAECTKVVNVISDSSGSDGGAQTDGSGGTASGNQITVPVDAAASICGNSVAAVGVSKAECVETISENPDAEHPDDGKDDKGKDDGKKDGDKGDKGKDDDGKDNGEDGKGKDDGEKDGDGKKDTADEKGAPADSDGNTSAGGSLPVTGAALGGLVAAAVAAIGGGGTVMYLSRKRKAAASAAADEGAEA